ncbi:hypothetical protein I4Q42_02110 [Caulobacter hibisci]|uniref:CdiI immunity protein domain-containing protein n=2 Tax=Caulobacter hibisci TaxID=2035993 RepID=A0ABS0SS64_9CAUL|nr:hypothetical protein [Caulobacter hibisci]
MPAFEESLEVVLGYLDHPPTEGTLEDAAFLAALDHVLTASLPEDDDEDLIDSLGLDDDLRSRLEAVALRRHASHPFGEHPGGIGPTLGMDLRLKRPH